MITKNICYAVHIFLRRGYERGSISKKTATMLGSGIIVLASATVGQSSSSSSPCEAGVGS